MVTTSRSGADERLRLLRSHGMTTGTWDRHTGHASDYDVVAMGWNFRPQEISAPRLGFEGLCELAEHNGRRREALRWYHDAFAATSADRPHRLIFDTFDPTRAHRGGGAARRPTRRRTRCLRAEGIQSSFHYPPIHRFTVFADVAARALPHTEAAEHSLVTLPMHPWLTEDEVRARSCRSWSGLPSSGPAEISRPNTANSSRYTPDTQPAHTAASVDTLTTAFRGVTGTPPAVSAPVVSIAAAAAAPSGHRREPSTGAVRAKATAREPITAPPAPRVGEAAAESPVAASSAPSTARNGGTAEDRRAIVGRGVVRRPRARHRTTRARAAPIRRFSSKSWLVANCSSQPPTAAELRGAERAEVHGVARTAAPRPAGSATGPSPTGC